MQRLMPTAQTTLLPASTPMINRSAMAANRKGLLSNPRLDDRRQPVGDPQITMSASGFAKMPHPKALQKTALDHSHTWIKNFLHHGRQPQKSFSWQR